MNKFHGRVLIASRRFLLSVARVMLRAGIGYREFSEIAKSAFVEVATNEYGLRGRKTNVSRVAVMTGLTRKEVKKVRDKLESGSELVDKRTPAGDVLHYWHVDKDFVDEAGRPKEIPYEGDNVSITALNRKYGGDIPPGAMFTELMRGKAIEKTDKGHFRVLKRHFVPFEPDERVLGSLHDNLSFLASTIEFNSRPDAPIPGRIERFVYNDHLKPSALPRFRRIARDNVAKFCEMMDDWLSGHELDRSQWDKHQTPRVGIGIFYFEE